MLARVLLGIVFGHLTMITQGQSLVITVDPSVNNSNCFSAQQLRSMNVTQPRCKTLNDALGNVTCDCIASEENKLDGVVIRLEDGKHRLSECLGLVGSTNIVFEAVNSGQATLTCVNFPNDDFDNLLVCGSRNISFYGIRFEECGPVSPNVFVNYTSNILFESCIFFQNKGSPLQMQFSTGVKILNTEFLQNNNSIVSEPDVNETNIEELYSGITTSGGFTFFSRAEDIEILIQNCQFTENSANRNDPNNSRPVLLKENGHGGAILIRLVNTDNARVEIVNNTFKSNSAQVDGGAIYIFLSEGASSSTFVVRNNTFTANNVEQASGGAVSVNSFSFTYNNTILVQDCQFLENNGSAGGAFSVALYNSNLNSTRLPDSVSFTNCLFAGNTAENEGTAVGLFSLVHVDQIGFPVSFTDCIFVNNTSLEDNQDTSAIAAFRFPTIFTGTNTFTGNIGGGITLLNTRMEASGTLWFQGNTAVFGGGIAMDDRCLLEISPNTSITFLENEATESGAGIYVEFPPIRFVVDIFNRLCFLQYKDPAGADIEPQNWQNVSISFIRNTARLSGAAIFASDMQQCSWLGNEFTTDSSIIFDPPANLTGGYYPFNYSDNKLRPEGRNVLELKNLDLATSPSTIMYEIPEYKYVQPGETLQISLYAMDQVNNSREAVWSLEAPSSPANLDALSANNNTYPYVIPAVQSLPGIVIPPGTNDLSNVSSDFSSQFNLTFSLLRTLGSVSTLSLNVNGCHPGYKLDPTTGQCACDTTNTNILRCDSNNRYLYLREGVWGTESSDGQRQLILARVQPGYVNCTRQGRLQGCLFAFDHHDSQCRNGRRGPLCGQCAENYSVTLDLQDCQETPCVAGLIVFLLYCLAVVVFCLVVLVVDKGLPNELKGFFFYVQVIGLVYRPYQVVQTTDSEVDTRALSIVLNLLGFSVPIPLCLWEGVPAHYIALLGYIPPGLALITIIGYVVAAQFISALGKHSALKALTFLSLFVYKYVADTAILFISCLSTGTEELGFVFQYDGSVSCISAEFGIFALIGVLLTVFFVVPTPFVLVYICERRPLRFQHYADVLTQGLRLKHRWWGGWDLGRRLPFVIIGVFIVYVRPSVILFLMSLVALAVLMIHVFTKPFEKMYINVIEAAILLNLLMVTAAFLDPSNSPVPFAFSTILVLLPYIYAAAYMLFRIGSMVWNQIKRMRKPDTDTQSSPAAKPEETNGHPQNQEGSPGNKLQNKSSTNNASSSQGLPANRSLGSGTQSGEPRNLAVSIGNSAELREPLLED